MTISNTDGLSYEAGKLIGSTEKFKLYQCSFGSNKTCILKIASLAEYNGILDREADLLQTLLVEVERITAECATLESDGKILDYQLLLPHLMDSFIDQNQDKRRINIIDLSHMADDLSQLVPLSLIISREHLRVDPRTSAWILGRLLKLLAFTHSQGVSLGFLNLDNILINREQHRVTIFDWSQAKINDAPLSKELATIEIAQVARETTLLLGGNPTDGQLPPDEQLIDDRYADHLRHLTSFKEGNAYEAHRKFYELIRALWPSGFYPYTTHKLTNL